MNLLKFQRIFLIVAGITVFASCQKDPGSPGNNNQKPKVGTTWVYTYYTYNINGGVATSGNLTYKAVSEQTLGGETWLTIKDITADTVVYYLKERSDGLYQYINNSSNIFLKSPATLNETYATFNRDTIEHFTVKSVNTQLPTSLGDISINYYEGFRGVNLIDQVWYNSNAWIVRHYVYKKPLMGSYYRYSGLFIETLTY